MASSQPWSHFPQAFLEELNAIIPSEKLDGVLDALSVERKPSFRINTLKISVDEAIFQLRKSGITIEQVSWCSEAFTIDPAEKERLVELAIVETGGIYSQSLSSILTTVIFDPNPHEEILDMCAAPGSKTSHIAARMENTGAIIANDFSKNRKYKLQANLKTLGVLNTQTVCLPGEWLWKKYPSLFDRVLVDAPCSMEGRFVATEPNTFEDWKPAKGKLLSQKQKYLLRSAVACTKPGGTIVYSTCTLNPRENEEVIDWILEKEKENVEIEQIIIHGVDVESGLTSWNKKTFSAEVTKAIRILPSLTMEGFFLAKLKRL